MTKFAESLLLGLLFNGLGVLFMWAVSQHYTKKSLLWWATESGSENRGDYNNTRRILFIVLALAGISAYVSAANPPPRLDQPQATPDRIPIDSLITLAYWIGLVVWYYRVKGIWKKANPLDIYGSAAWAGLDEVRRWMHDNGRDGTGATVRLGEVPEGRRPWLLSWKTEKHVLIVASAGSGKGTDLIIPNLLTYEGSVFVLDPKGENARATVRHRATRGTVHCIDPWGLTGQPTSRFNPLARLCQDGNEADVATAAAALAAAIVLPDHGNNRYFTDTARQLLEGLIAYVVTEPNLRPVADLKLVRTLLTQHLRPTLDMMAAMQTGPDSIRSNAGRMQSLGDKEFGSVVSSAITETAFLDDPRLQDCLSGVPERQLDFAEWRSGNMSVYLCLPAPYFKSFNRWLRLLVTSALDEMMRKHRPPPLPVMFMLDELATLERLQPVEDAIGLARGYGVQIWSIFQDLGQMKDIYRERATSFFGNAGIRLFFGTQDHDTAQTVSNILGTRTWDLEVERAEQTSATRHGGRPLLMPDEIMRLPENEMICVLPAKPPLRLQRLPYYRDPQLKGLWDDPRQG